jgi:hypothetical protein
MYTSYSQMHSIVYSVSTCAETSVPLVKEKVRNRYAFSNCPTYYTGFFFYQMTLQNWYVFLISDNGAAKLSQTFLRTWEKRLLNRNVFSKVYLQGQNVGRVKNLNESVLRRKFSF